MWNFKILSFNVTPLYFAIISYRHDVVELLLDNENIDVNAKSNLKNVQFNDSTIIEETPLYLTARADKSSFIELLLKNKQIDVNLKSKEITIKDNVETVLEKAPLHAAAGLKSFLCLNYLLNSDNIDINILDNQGKKPIDYAENEDNKFLFKKFAKK